MARMLLTENMWLPGWQKSAGRRPLAEAQSAAEDVKSHGLSESEYIAVVPAELGTGGVVNGNGRIYPVPRFATENAGLHTRAQSEFVGAESGHPDGLPTFNVAARIIEVEVVDADGNVVSSLEQRDDGAWVIPEDAPELPAVVHARGKLAFLRTEAGNDLWVCYRAGMPLGTSSRSYGIPVPHKLEDGSPYLGANADHVGETVDLIEGQELITYDVVTVPSAGTYVQGNAGAAAFDSLREHAPALPPRTTENPPRGGDMKYDRKWLRENAPELFAALEAAEAKAGAADNPLLARVAKLGEAEAGRLGSLLDIVTGTGGDAGGDDELIKRVGAMVEAQVAPLKAEHEKLRGRVTAAEEKARKADEARAAEAKKVAKLEAEKAERERADAIDRALGEALDGVHKNLRERVERFVRGSVDAGQITDPAKLAEEVKRVAELLADVSNATAEQTGGGAGGNSNAADPDADDGTNDDAPGEGDDDAVVEALLGEDWQDGFGRMLNRNTDAE